MAECCSQIKQVEVSGAKYNSRASKSGKRLGGKSEVRFDRTERRKRRTATWKALEMPEAEVKETVTVKMPVQQLEEINPQE